VPLIQEAKRLVERPVAVAQLVGPVAQPEILI
jgi:hypothetical protein